MTQITGEIVMVAVTRIIPGDNDRTVFNQAQLEELAESIKLHGLAQPITVRPLPTGKLQIVAGERRFRAISTVLCWAEAPCIVREMGDEEASAVMLAENTCRADLNPIDEAKAYQKRVEQFGWSESKIAQAAGVTAGKVARRISLLRLAPELQALVANGNLDVSKAEMLTVLDHNRQRIAVRVATPEMAKVSFQAMVNNLHAEQAQDKLFDLEQFWAKQIETGAANPFGENVDVIIPLNPDLPQIEGRQPGQRAKKSGDVIYDYVIALLRAGRQAEAEAVGVLYKALIAQYSIAVPAKVLAMSPDQQRAAITTATEEGKK